MSADEQLIIASKLVPWTGRRNVTGYGSQMPTDWMVHYAGKWRRIYVINYGNAGSAFVIVNGQRELFVFDQALTNRVHETRIDLSPNELVNEYERNQS